MKIAIRRALTLLLGSTDRILGRVNPITIYTYHTIADDNYFYSVTPTDFAKQMEYLSHTHNFVSLSDISDYFNKSKSLPTRAVAVTFDDGYADNLTIISTIKKYGIRPTIFLLSAGAKVARFQLGTKKPFLSSSEIIRLKNHGWEFGSHTLSHVDLTSISHPQSQIPHPTSQPYFSYPWGRYSDNAVQAVKTAGYTLGLSMDDDPISHKSNPLILPRIGVNRTHTLAEFSALNSPSVITMRKFLKRLHIYAT